MTSHFMAFNFGKTISIRSKARREECQSGGGRFEENNKLKVFMVLGVKELGCGAFRCLHKVELEVWKNEKFFGRS